jgi:two-component system cell cycle sensor histidine kinase/response regulator CckA
MSLKTVRVPESMQGPFVDAERHVSRYFEDRRDDPEHGTIEIFGERYILVRAASLSVEFFALVADLYGEGRATEADEFTRNILFDLAHAVGKSDAANFHTKMGLHDPIAKLSAGPIHFAHAGWAFVEIFPESKPTPDADYYLLYDHPYSFESDAWLRAGKKRDAPACIMNAGYSSGWCEESFGVTLVAAEVLCRAKGDPVCRFLMAHPSRIDAHVERYVKRAQAPISTYQVPDFFARKRMEEELRKAKGELEERVRERTQELVRSNELLKKEIEQRQKVERQLLQTHKLEAIGRLAGGIAHDFNNLMAVILGNGGLLARRLPKDDPLQIHVEQMVHAGDRAAKLTQQLLAFSRAQMLAREVLELNDVVRSVGHMLERVLGENVALETKLCDDAGAIAADRGQLEQVVMNLVVNARDAMPAGGTVTVETLRETISLTRSLELGGIEPGDYARLDVSDVGTGMSEETQSQIFDPFFTTKETGKGTGLGLSTVYGIVRQAGGAIVVTSAPGEGARFTILLPRVTEVSPSHAVGALGAGGAAVARGSETVLVVEDQEALRNVVAEVLAEWGYRVLKAKDAESALRMVDTHSGPIDLLLTDVLMPTMSGPDLAERVVAARPGTKVLFMSGYTDDVTLRKVSKGEVDLLSKPFSPEALAKKVREVLGASASDGAAQRSATIP